MTSDKGALIRGIIAALRALDADVERIEEQAAARLGVNLRDFRCLDILSRGEPMTAGRLAAEAGLTTGATTTLVDRLARAGYVRRARDAQDRRRVLITPTRHATRRVWPLFRGVVKSAGAVLSTFTTAELATILRFLEMHRLELRRLLGDRRIRRSPRRRERPNAGGRPGRGRGPGAVPTSPPGRSRG